MAHKCSCKKECEKDVHIITKEKLPYTICKSGTYKVCGDLKYSPKHDGSSAITVKEGVTDVVIDFAGYTLKMSSQSTTADNFGILLKANVSNVVIQNGTIKGFSASQIRGYNNLDTIVIRNMVLEGILQANGGQRMVNEVISSGVNIGPIDETQDFVPHPELVSNNITISNVTVNGFFLNNLNIADQILWGICMFNCNNVNLDHVNVSKLTNNGLIENANGETLAFGFYISTNCISRFCTGNDITSLTPNFQGLVTGDAAGVNYLLCDRVENYDCSYNNNVGTRRGGGLTWVGTTNFVAERCVADSNIIVDQTAPGRQSHYGIEVVGNIGPFPICQRGVVKNCQVLNMPTAFVAINALDVIFENCNAVAGNLATVSTVLTEGFQASGGDGITFKNCIATGFVVPNPSTQGGFRISSANNVNIVGCKSTKNSIGIRVNNGSTNVVADSNELSFNTEYGILDNTPVQTPNLYIRNVAYSNPVNYQVATSNPNFKVVQSNQAAAFPTYTAVNASPLSNFDIQP